MIVEEAPRTDDDDDDDLHWVVDCPTSRLTSNPYGFEDQVGRCPARQHDMLSQGSRALRTNENN